MTNSLQPRNESSGDWSDASDVLNLFLYEIIPGFAVLTVILIGFIWFKSGCYGAAGRTGENDDESLPVQLKYMGSSSGREQAPAPPPYGTARSLSGSATERWGDDRTMCDEGDDHHSEHREEFREPTVPSLSSRSDSNGLKPKTSSVRDTPAA